MREKIRYWIAWLATWFSCRKIQQQKDKLRKTELAMIAKYPQPQAGPFVEHKDYLPHLQKCIKNFRAYMRDEYASDKVRAWLVGDSIAAQTRDCMGLSLVRYLMNHSLGGMWCHHMKQLAQDMTSVFRAFNYKPRVIVVGTPGGNNLLNRQEVSETSYQFRDLFYYLRNTYLDAKIVVYGLPASIVGYLIQNRPAIHKVVRTIVELDGNATFLEMQDGFVEDRHVLPAADESADGVHLTPLGQLQFDADITAGIQAAPGSIIP